MILAHYKEYAVIFDHLIEQLNIESSIFHSLPQSLHAESVLIQE